MLAPALKPDMSPLTSRDGECLQFPQEGRRIGNALGDLQASILDRGDQWPEQFPLGHPPGSVLERRLPACCDGHRHRLQGTDSQVIQHRPANTRGINYKGRAGQSRCHAFDAFPDVGVRRAEREPFKVSQVVLTVDGLKH